VALICKAGTLTTHAERNSAVDLTPATIDAFVDVFKILIPTLFVIAFFKSRFFKGWIGEFIVNTLSWMVLDKQKYHLIRNVTLPV
jgi:hypothetical protein